MITDPWFYAVAIPAIVLTGLSKSGFLGGVGGLAVPIMSLVISPVQAAGIMLPILLAMDAVGVWAYRREWDGPNLRIIVPAAAIGIAVGLIGAFAGARYLQSMLFGIEARDPGTFIAVAVMFAMVTFIATLIHIFALGYMGDETQKMVDDHQAHVTRRGRYQNFFMWFSLFSFSMLNLVIADNFFQVFICWELVGVCSYFLIGFYYEQTHTRMLDDLGGMMKRMPYIGTLFMIMTMASAGLMMPQASESSGGGVNTPLAMQFNNHSSSSAMCRTSPRPVLDFASGW